MSAISTPTRSNGSSPAVSPIAQKSRSPINLTPRSKIQAMLAAFDDDDDDADGSGKENKLGRIEKRAERPQVQDKTAGILGQSGQDQDDSSEEDDIVRRPKGRLTDRLRMGDGQLAVDETASDSDGDAYERVKRRLLAPASTAVNRRLGNSSNLSILERNTPSAENISTPLRPVSPGLFLTPEEPLASEAMSKTQDNYNSDADVTDSPRPGDRLKALLARKRGERLAKEKARQSDEEADLSTREFGRRREKSRVNTIVAESESDNDEDATRKLTQHVRPTRKASKKALEEMHRETQRMSRNMQLTHQAKTKTKFTTAAFLAKFNFRQSSKLVEPQQMEEHASSSSIDVPDSDTNPGQTVSTPPSSPPSVLPTGSKSATEVFTNTEMSIDPIYNVPVEDEEDEDDDELPDLDTLLTEARQNRDHVSASGTQLKAPAVKHSTTSTKRFSLKSFGKSVKRLKKLDDSGDDLEIVKPGQTSRLAIFDQIPANKAKDSSSLHALRTLAHLHENDNARNKTRKSMTTSELQNLLQRRAKEQAARERDEKIQRLKEKGVIVMSVEDREKDQLQLENMLEKARREADELAEKEKTAAKKARKNGDNQDELLDTDDEDEDWDGSADEGGGVELSGSEDEEAELRSAGASLSDGEDEEPDDGSVPGDDAEEPAKSQNQLLDDEASEDTEDEEQEGNLSGHNSSIEMLSVKPQLSRRIPNRRRTVVPDDEDEDDESQQSAANHVIMTETSKSQPSLSDAFGFAHTKAAIPGLSQVFAGTMSDSPPDNFEFAAQPPVPGLSAIFANTIADDQTQMSGDTEVIDTQEMKLFQALPRPSLHDFGANFQDESHSFVVQDSQTNETQTPFVHFDTQTQAGYPETQISQMPDPTPDVGFQILKIQSPAPSATFATVATLPLSTPLIPASPEAQRKGRLVRGHRLDNDSDDEDGDVIDEMSDVLGNDIAANAFDIMRNATHRTMGSEVFDKKKSEAKAMVEDQAEESEDEYAGLGGASDDESHGEMDEEIMNMIDDEGKEKVNEADIAAYYANKERINDEKQVEKLYRDIATGGLRRKRGADMDFFESDDEDEAAVRRRATKQREFARMRKALLADEKLGKIAENPKQQAFLQAIEDHEEDEELDILGEPEETVTQVTDSQGLSQNQTGEPQHGQAAVNRKRTFADFAAAQSTKVTLPHLPPNLRRTNKFTKPTSIMDIRNTLSEILGEPDGIAETQLSPSPEHSGGEDDDGEVDEHSLLADLHYSDKENIPTISGNPRRTPINPTKVAVIDRIALKRGASCLANRSHGTSDRLAFQAPTLAASSSFRKPSLLRRATTSGSNATTTSADSTVDRVGQGKEMVKMGGSKKSSVNFYAREQERVAKIEQIEKERRDGRERIGKMRRSGMGLNSLVGGAFD